MAFTNTVAKLTEEQRERLRRTSSAKENKVAILEVMSEYLGINKDLYKDENWNKKYVVDFLMKLRKADDAKSIAILDDGAYSEFHWIFQNWYARSGGEHEFIGTQSWWHLIHNKKITHDECEKFLRLIPLWTIPTKETRFIDGFMHPKGTAEDLSPLSTTYHNKIKAVIDGATNFDKAINEIRKINKEFLDEKTFDLSEKSLEKALRMV